MEENDFKENHCIMDSARGIYIPRDFANTIDLERVKDLEKFTEDLEICKKPDHEHYWEAWQNILDNMQIDLFGKGIFYNLYQDGDLFAVIYGDPVEAELNELLTEIDSWFKRGDQAQKKLLIQSLQDMADVISEDMPTIDPPLNPANYQID